jgi:hypothetical protein
MAPERSEANDGGIPAAIGGTQTSTTKALLAFIQVPRVYRVYIANEKDAKKAAEEKEEEDESSKSPSSASKRQSSFASLRDERPILPRDSTDSTHSKQLTETKIQEEAEGEENDDETTIEQNIGYVEAEPSDRSKKSLVEHVVTAEEMATIVKLDDPALQTGEKEEKPESETNPITSAMKVFFGVVTNKQDEVTGRLSREEAIRAMKEQASQSNLHDASPAQSQRDSQQPAPNTEIKVEALLRITCKNLFNEGCFFTAPTITSITKGEQGEEWIQFTIMCKPNSIGLVLERLERIGVGSSVGMIAIYKSELLKTADSPSPQMQTDQQQDLGGTKTKLDDGVNLEAARNEWKNAACRLRIEQVKEQIHEQAVSYD